MHGFWPLTPPSQPFAVRCVTKRVFSLPGALPKASEIGEPRAVQSGENQSMKAAKVGNLAHCICGECLLLNATQAGH